MAKRPKSPRPPKSAVPDSIPRKASTAEKRTVEEADANRDGESVKTATPNYEVGYKKPPPEHRFKPGQSGNPRGGKRGPRKPDVTRILEEMVAVFQEKVEAKSGDKIIKLSRIKAATHALVQKAGKADVPAMRVMLEILTRMQSLPLPVEDDDGHDEAVAGAEIEAYLRRLRGASDPKGAQP